MLLPLAAQVRAAGVSEAAVGADRSDPAGCFELTSPNLSVRTFRADGQTGVVGLVSECETLVYQVVLTKAGSSPTGCAFFGGVVDLSTPDGVVHRLASDVPCVGGQGDNGSGCSPFTQAWILPPVSYRVHPEDLTGGAVTAHANYEGWRVHSIVGPLDGTTVSEVKSTFVVRCLDADPCSSDLCNPALAGPAACSHPVNPFGCFVCGDGTVQEGEACDVAAANGRAESCCTFDCRLLPAGDECRASVGACDVAEVCDGVGGACPADAKRPSGTECRSAEGVCDLPEVCDGASGGCPAVDAIAIEQVCRPAVDACDVAEQCDGVTKSCPPDARAVPGTSCGDGDSCDGGGQCVNTCGNGVREAWEACDLPARPGGQWCTATCRIAPCDWRSVAESRPATIDGSTLLCSLTEPVAGTDCGSDGRLLKKVNGFREAARRRVEELEGGHCGNARVIGRKLKEMTRRLNRLSVGLRFGACTSNVVGPALLTWADLTNALREHPEQVCPQGGE
jgi:hypothetical protein